MRKILSWFKSLLWSNRQDRKQALRNISADDIRRECIKLEQTETRLTRVIEDLERQKQAFFEQGVKSGTDRQKLHCARKVKEIDQQVQARDKLLVMVSEQRVALTAIAQMKEYEKTLRGCGLGELVKNLDLEEVQLYVEQSTIETQFQVDKLRDIQTALVNADNVYQIETDDADTLAILEAMNRASAQAVNRSVQEQDLHAEPVLNSASATN